MNCYKSWNFLFPLKLASFKGWSIFGDLLNRLSNCKSNCKSNLMNYIALYNNEQDIYRWFFQVGKTMLNFDRSCKSANLT